MIKKILLSVVILFFMLFGVIAWGLYLMEIEDHYGDLQEIYFQSKDGDLIINKKTKQYGIITKNWKRANIITKENDTLDLYNFIYSNDKAANYEVFRKKGILKIHHFDFEIILELQRKNLIETIIKN